MMPIALLGATAMFVTFLAITPASHAAEWSCQNDAPLIKQSAGIIMPGDSPELIGKWHLPASSQQPDLLIDAFVEVYLVPRHPPAPYEIQVRVYFERNQPGLPYTFAYLKLEWKDETTFDQIHEAVFDWSQDCNSVGWSIFPGQELKDFIPAPSIHLYQTIYDLKLRLWGDRS